MPKIPEYSLHESLGYLVYQASGLIRKRVSRELAGNGYPIKTEQFSMLLYIWDEDGQPQHVLAEKMHRDKTMVTKVVAGIEKLGLVERLPGKDGREKCVFLTQKGKLVMAEVTQLVQRVLQHAQKSIEPKNVAICKDVLTHVLNNLS